MKLALDHHYAPAIAEQLRGNGHDVVAARERGLHREDDEALLTFCAAERRAVLTNNVGDFTAIARRWAGDGRSHAGLIFTSDASMPRHRGTIGRYVAALDQLHRAHPADDALDDRIHWLCPWTWQLSERRNHPQRNHAVRRNAPNAGPMNRVDIEGE